MNQAVRGSLCRLVFIAAFCFFSAGAQANLQEGIDAFQAGNHRAALGKFAPLAENGNAVAQFYMGKIYMQGIGSRPDYNKALLWARKAAQQRNSDAEHFIGFMHYYGMGVSQSYKEAMSWYRKAADSGNVKAQSSLGMMFVNAEGTPQDLVQAYKWLKLAEKAGDADAGSKLRAVEEKMTAQQIKEGDALVQKWGAKPTTTPKPKKKNR